MKYLWRFGIVACLICSAFLFAQSNPKSAEQKPPVPEIIVSPVSATVTSGGGQQFSASVPGNANATFVWSVSGPGCTGETCGSISAAGLYMAPLNVPILATVTVTATLASDTLRKSSATVTIKQAPRKLFTNSASGSAAGLQIAQAARPSVASRDFSQGTPMQGGLEVLSDTQGVDFGSYLKSVLDTVKKNWYALIPASARPPIMRSGRVGIEFAIKKDGSISDMKLVSTSGDVALDRGAWGGIAASNPFPPLPQEFMGQYVALRFRFYYNPAKGDMDKPTDADKPTGAIVVSPALVQLTTGGQEQFSATVPNTKDSTVIWTVSCAAANDCGSISADGLYKAPLKPVNVTVMATLASDPGKTGSAMVTIHESPSEGPPGKTQ